MDIEDWLRRLGLEQYAAAFRENEVDADVLPSLTSDDLREIGVVAVGHRRKLLDAIAALSARPTPPATEAVPPAPAGITASPRTGREDAERRPITVMFCDLVGSTDLSAKLDAEDWRELVGAYLDDASRAVTQYGGHVLKKLGDGLMALFGYPTAQENDGERAARAGLAILRAIEELNARNAGRGLPALAARIGLESGPVVVDATGEVFGDAPNVAARVQSAAHPGTLFVTAGVQRQLAGLFLVEDKGPHDLKGVPGRPLLYRLVRASGGGRRAGARALTPLVGRGDELATLMRRWERAKAGEGQFVQIVGEPGLGKSRLVEELRLRLVDTPHTWIEWSSSQLLQNTPLHPVAEWGRQRFTGEDRFAELEAALAAVNLDPEENAPLLAPLLDILPPPDRTPQASPGELRRRQLAASAAWVLAGARAQPMVLAIEDLHWADPTTLDLMKTLAERGAQAPLLVAATSRPEFRPSWTTRSHHGVIALGALDRGQIGQMVNVIVERHAVSAEAMERLTERTGGVPLFVEELTRLLLEGGAQRIPQSLQQSLAARLDRLGDARELAQVGAVLGREFSLALLSAVAGFPASEDALNRLVDADLLYVDGIGAETTYRFKHALIQDAAYESLLKARRQALHRRAADALRAGYAPSPELVAHHLTQSGQMGAALAWWSKAGEAAYHRSAFQEAMAHFSKAIEMLGEEADAAGARPEGGATGDVAAGSAGRTAPERADLAKLYGDHARATMYAKGFSSPETKAALERANRYSEASIPAKERLRKIAANWARCFVGGEMAQACTVAAEALADPEFLGQSASRWALRRCLGMAYLFSGDLRSARGEFESVLSELAASEHGDALKARYSEPVVVSSAYLSMLEFIAGDVDKSDRMIARAIEDAKSSDPASYAMTLLSQCGIEIFRSRPHPLLEVSSEMNRVCVERNMQTFTDISAVYCAMARGLQTDAISGSREMRNAMEIYLERGNRCATTTHHAYLAEFEAKAGDIDSALRTIERGLRLVSDTGEYGFHAGLLRMKGDILLRAGADAGARAEDAYRSAISVSQKQGAHIFELLASIPLARILRGDGRSAEAREILGRAVASVPPSSQMPDLSEARALLASM